VLNRLYIVVGVLAILVLAAGFVLPRFIDWGGYREQMEAVAAEALGTEVEIVGDIEVTLLPQPRMTFSDVIIGPPETPVAMIGGVEAEFSLFDFLRDQYRVTKLVIEQPRLELRIDEQGQLQTGIWLAGQLSRSNVSIANAEIAGGTVRLTDERTAETYDLAQIAGELEMSAVQGPFTFTGTGIANRQSYSLRLSTGAVDSSGSTRLSAFVQPVSNAFSLTAEGTLITSPVPKFEGDVTYRQRPPTAGQADNVTGDMVIVSKTELAADKPLLTSYTIVPDENRSGTRLTGAAEVTFGADPKFNAVISGGAMALPPRDATAEAEETPYELVRLLSELPLPPVPAMAGTIGIDITELNIRAVALRNVRVDATTDAKTWTVDEFSALLPGNTRMELKGAVTEANGKPAFAGTLAMATNRLEALAGLWRKPGEGSPLVNMPAELNADVRLDGSTLSVSNGSFVLESEPHAFSAQVGIADNRHLQLSVDFGVLSPLQSAALVALAPDFANDAGFGLTFPKGEVTLTAKTATVAGLEGENLKIAAGWQGGVLEVDEISGMLGGADVSGKLTAFGTLAKPEMFGNGTVRIASADAPALGMVFDTLGTPDLLREAIRKFVPADLTLFLEQPGGDGGQQITMNGDVAGAALKLQALLSGGILKATKVTVSTTVSLESDDPVALTEQLGLGDIGLFPDTGPMKVEMALTGSAADGFESSVSLEGGGDSLQFVGGLNVANIERWTGTGVIRATLSDPTPLAERVGAQGLALPAIEGNANIAFAGAENLALNDLNLRSGEQTVTGSLMLRTTAGDSRMSGELAVGAIDLGGLAALLAGPAALVTAPDSVWPIGPLSTGTEPRTVTGRVRITTPGIFAGENEQPLVADASFDGDWDATKLSLRALDGTVAGGEVAADIAICCAGPLPDKQLTGRVTLTGATLDDVLPPRLAAALDGKLDLVAQFDGTGDSIAAIAGALTGQGNFGVSGLKIERFDPGTFATIAALDNLLDIEPAALTPLVADALSKGAFAVPNAAGSFTIAGGVLRSPNLALEASDVRLFGGANVKLADLALDGSYTLSPKGAVGEEGLINERTSQITALLTGTLIEPEERLDLGTMVDGIKVRAYEIELEQLERLRAEDEARVAAAAAERQRQVAQQEAYRWAVAAAKFDEERQKALVAANAEATRIADAVAIAHDVVLEGANPAPVTTPAPAPAPTLSPAAPTVDVAPPVTAPPTVFLAPLNLTPTESSNQF
jgi:uncharacterized protein involved in outer membrane biogenesis